MPKGVYARAGAIPAEKLEDTKIEQMPDIIGTEREPEVVLVEDVLKKEYTDELAFNEQPMTIVIESGGAENAPTTHPVWVNGKGGEMLIGGKWCSVAYFPIGEPFTTRRKYVAVLAGAKISKVSISHTNPEDMEPGRPSNVAHRATSNIVSLSVLRDDDPRGGDWLREIHRRNMG
jgi:hypothetical protein